MHIIRESSNEEGVLEDSGLGNSDRFFVKRRSLPLYGLKLFIGARAIDSAKDELVFYLEGYGYGKDGETMGKIGGTV